MRGEALQYPWNIWSAEVIPKVSIQRRHLARSLTLLDQGYVPMRLRASVPAQARNLLIFK
jgi:hypothetical protein